MALLPLIGVLALAPSEALAQKVPWIILPLAASPLVAVVLAAVLGVAARSWSVGLKNAAWVIVWVAWFLAASEFPAPDPVIWASVVALGLHLLVMSWLVVLQTIRRGRARDEA